VKRQPLEKEVARQGRRKEYVPIKNDIRGGGHRTGENGERRVRAVDGG